MALAIEWEKPLDAETLDTTAAVARKNEIITGFLTTERKFPAFEIKVEADQAEAPSVQNSALSVVDFIRSNPAGKIEWALSLRPDFFSCNCTVYDRWADVKPQALRVLGIVAGTALDRGNRIKAVGLQYSDSFKWLASDKGALKEVLRVGTPSLPAAAIDRPYLWHSHNGWFSPAAGGRRLLTVINVDYGEEPPDRVLRIHGQHKIETQSFEDASKLMPLALTDLDEVADNLHSSNKGILREILSDAALNLIGMGT